MKEKKVSPDWYIAATHWLTAGFVIPFVAGVILGILLAALADNNITILLNVNTFLVVSTILDMVILWLGVIYASKYLEKTYVINNAKKIVMLATIYFIIIDGGFIVFKFVQSGVFNYEYIIGFILKVVVFYLASKKYIKNNSFPISNAI